MSKLGAVIAFASMLAAPASGRSQVASPSMLGAWQGDGHVVVNWTRQRTLAVQLVLFAGDSVSGTIGDAKLVNARFMKNAGASRWKTEYVIEGNLEGCVIRAENIWRTSVQIPLDWIDDRFEGSINTSGWKVGNAELRALTATIVLTRPPVAAAAAPIARAVRTVTEKCGEATP
jgi:hypothetical protein